MALIFESNRQILRIEKEGDSLKAYREDGNEYANIDKLMYDISTREAFFSNKQCIRDHFLSCCHEEDWEAAIERRKREKEEKKRRAAEINAEWDKFYDATCKKVEDAARKKEVWPATLESVKTIMEGIYGGADIVPAIQGIGYSFNRYDCGGQTAVGIKLGRPINGYTMLSYAAPIHYLTRYTPISRAIADAEEEEA